MSNAERWDRSLESLKIAVIGLGYVGLPLAVEFGKCRPVVGYDINDQRIKSLRAGFDSTLEVSECELAEARDLIFSASVADLEDCNFYIVTVPTPIDATNKPDLEPLIRASRIIGGMLNRGDVVVYESTVYPGATEEVCVPILEESSGLVFNTDFYVGYSPERINPGDKDHRLANIVKVTSGSTPEVAALIDELYSSIIIAGTHKAPSIRVAEAAKVIENTQRDLNIALINELAKIFYAMNIDTEAVLTASGTKWNFLPFRPGLVGGHCIGVDPYYLTYKAEAIGYTPELILAGRKLNDGMGVYVGQRMVDTLSLTQGELGGHTRVLIMGVTFKENCPDIRNTKVVDIVSELMRNSIKVDIWDPNVDVEDARNVLGMNIVASPQGNYDGIIIAVAHRAFIELGERGIRDFGKPDAVVFDLKYVLRESESDIRL